ncbi:MmgE/PrpD family protein [Hydrogenophaga sp. OTU3427]|uniref:MmgE/PrpD family protein n=1 Tax=Hydrogenophaga sp. OTU3427 TaxID=3043856 RepID=UPI00313C906B
MAVAESVSRSLAERLHSISFDRLPSAVVQHAKDLLVDTRMVAAAGFMQSDVQAAAELLIGQGGRAESGVWSGAARIPAPQAAFLNALAASALDYDSLHLNVHPDAITLAAAWAVGEQVHASGADTLRAFILGSELICRLSAAVSGSQKGWTIGAVLGTFGAAAVASVLMKLSVDETVAALGLCLSVAAGSQQSNVEQVLAKRMQPAFATRNGVQCAALARIGVTGPTAVFEGRFGLSALYFPLDVEKIVDGWGDRYAMLETGLKKYPVCACSHAAMDALVSLLDEENIAAVDIQHIESVISPFMDRLVGAPFDPDKNPQVTAQFSLRYALAVLALRRKLGIADLQATAVRDPAIASIVDRITLRTDSSNMGELAPARVIVTTTSGLRYEREVRDMPGSKASPLSGAERACKFLDCEAAVYTEYAGGQLHERLDAMAASLQTISDISGWSL